MRVGVGDGDAVAAAWSPTASVGVGDAVGAGVNVAVAVGAGVPVAVGVAVGSAPGVAVPATVVKAIPATLVRSSSSRASPVGAAVKVVVAVGVGAKTPPPRPCDSLDTDDMPGRSDSTRLISRDSTNNTVAAHTKATATSTGPRLVRRSHALNRSLRCLALLANPHSLGIAALPFHPAGSHGRSPLLLLRTRKAQRQATPASLWIERGLTARNTTQ